MLLDFFARGSYSLHKGEFQPSTRHKGQLFQGHRLWLPSGFKTSLELQVIFFQEKKIFFIYFFFWLAHI